MEKLAAQGTQDEEEQKTHYMQTYTNNVNKTRAVQQTTRGKDEPNIVFMWKS